MSSMLIQLVAALVGTVAFAALYDVPVKYYIHCGIIGAIGWLVYSLLMRYAMFSSTEAAFVATCIIVLLSRILAVLLHCPVTVFLITGIFVLVPGGDIYWAAYYFVTQQSQLASQYGLSALMVALGIVLGIVVILELPQKLFSSHRRK